MRAKHYRVVTRDKLGLSMKIPCNCWGLNLTRDSTKDASLVTCRRCLAYLKNNKQSKQTL